MWYSDPSTEGRLHYESIQSCLSCQSCLLNRQHARVRGTSTAQVAIFFDPDLHAPPACNANNQHEQHLQQSVPTNETLTSLEPCHTTASTTLLGDKPIEICQQSPRPCQVDTSTTPLNDGWRVTNTNLELSSIHRPTRGILSQMRSSNEPYDMFQPNPRLSEPQLASALAKENALSLS